MVRPKFYSLGLWQERVGHDGQEERGWGGNTAILLHGYSNMLMIEGKVTALNARVDALNEGDGSGWAAEYSGITDGQGTLVHAIE